VGAPTFFAHQIFFQSCWHRGGAPTITLPPFKKKTNNRWNQTRVVMLALNGFNRSRFHANTHTNTPPPHLFQLIKQTSIRSTRPSMAKSPRRPRRPTVYLNPDGTPPLPPQGGWRTTSKNSAHGRELTRLFKIGAIPPVSRSVILIVRTVYVWLNDPALCFHCL
jgi:hypothetical protein